MREGLGHVKAWIAAAARSGGLWAALGLSIGLAVVSLVVAGAVVVTWPPDRFRHGAPSSFMAAHPPALRVLGHIGKNVAGVVLFLLGVIMALPGVPGQGVLTMIIGLTLVDFPGKLGVERRLVSRPFVLRRLNALRHRFKRPALELE
jgi:hypothetical protein